MHGNRCIAPGSMVFVLRLLRVLGLAPVTITKQCNGYSIALSSLYALIGYVGFAFMNILMFICVWYNIQVKQNKKASREQFPLVTFMWIADVFFCTIITGIAAYSCEATMRNLMEHISLLAKVNSGFERKHNKWIIIFVVFTRMFLDTFNLIKVSCEHSIHGTQDFVLFALRVKYIAICLIQVYFFALHELVYSKVRLFRQELQELTAFLEYDFENSSQEFIQTINMKLQKKYGTLVSIREIFTKMNSCNEFIVFLLFVSTATRILQATFRIVNYSVTGPLEVFLQVLYLLHHVLTLTISIQPFRGMDIEMHHVKLLLARISTTNYVKTSIPLPLENLYKELFTTELSFSPFGVFTMHRSLIAKTLGAVISYLVIIVQFKVD